MAMGAGKPLNGWWDESRIPDSGKTFSTDLVTGRKIPCASRFIIEQCEKYGDSLTVAAIGPLTNVGLALAQAPHIAGHMHIVLMGGQVTKAHPEWNILCDPEAARIVFESGADIRMVGLDVTNQMCIRDRPMERYTSGFPSIILNPSAPIRKSLSHWLRKSPSAWFMLPKA